MSCLSRHAQTLRQRGYRMTPQRFAILEALHQDGHLSPPQIYARVAQTGMTEATVYRTLDFLRANGILAAAYSRDGHLTYSLVVEGHHHLICRLCGQETEVEQAALEEALAHIEAQTGYRLRGGHLTLVGLCPACQRLLENS